MFVCSFVLFRDLSSITSTVSVYKSIAQSIVDRYELCFPYRPDLPIHGHARIWWKYAVGCIVRRLRQEFPDAFRVDSVWDWGKHLKV